MADTPPAEAAEADSSPVAEAADNRRVAEAADSPLAAEAADNRRVAEGADSPLAAEADCFQAGTAVDQSSRFHL
jgi:hypothetical protein